MNGIIVYGGAFDPIGNHHIEIAKLARDATGFPVVFLPCFHHVFDKQPSKASDRLYMVAAAIEDEKDLLLDPIEIETKHNGATWETLLLISSHSYNDKKIHVLIGTDNALIINQWKRWKYLISSYPFIVVGEAVEENHWCRQKPHRFIERSETMRSTTIREAIKNQDWNLVKENVPSNVCQVIKEKGLYQ